MVSKLAENAGRMARGETAPEPEMLPAPAAAPASYEPLPDVEVDEPGPDGPEKVPVHVAWSRVMADVRKIGKGGKGNTYTGPGGYDFRGIDRTVNVFGPVLRKHGVLVLPVKVDAKYRDVRTSQNKPSKETTVTVSWMVIGPEGDQLPMLLESAGEALDSSDKGTAKAQSVAQRVLLLTAAQVPTGDPDPDLVNIERGEAEVRSPASYLDEITDTGTSRARLLQIKHELIQMKQAGALVTNETGDQEPIVKMIDRLGFERFGG